MPLYRVLYIFTCKILLVAKFLFFKLHLPNFAQKIFQVIFGPIWGVRRPFITRNKGSWWTWLQSSYDEPQIMIFFQVISNGIFECYISHMGKACLPLFLPLFGPIEGFRGHLGASDQKAIFGSIWGVWRPFFGPTWAYFRGPSLVWGPSRVMGLLGRISGAQAWSEAHLGQLGPILGLTRRLRGP